MKILLIVIIGLLTLTLLSCFGSQSKNVTLVSVEKKQMLLDLEEVQLIDVRTPAEYENGHIDDSQNIDYNSSTFNEDIMHLDKNKPVILYCQKGGRSAKSVKKWIKQVLKKYMI